MVISLCRGFFIYSHPQGNEGIFQADSYDIYFLQPEPPPPHPCSFNFTWVHLSFTALMNPCCAHCQPGGPQVRRDKCDTNSCRHPDAFVSAAFCFSWVYWKFNQLPLIFLSFFPPALLCFPLSFFLAFIVLIAQSFFLPFPPHLLFWFLFFPPFYFSLFPSLHFSCSFDPLTSSPYILSLLFLFVFPPPLFSTIFFCFYCSLKCLYHSSSSSHASYSSCCFHNASSPENIIFIAVT